jgi:hypothetical protein
MSGPVHEHDCDACVYIATYPLRHPRCPHCFEQRNGYGHVVKQPNGDSICLDCYCDTPIVMGDIYHTCDPDPFYRFIVRYGEMGEYATTSVPSRYVLAPWVDGKTRFDD